MSYSCRRESQLMIASIVLTKSLNGLLDFKLSRKMLIRYSYSSDSLLAKGLFYELN